MRESWEARLREMGPGTPEPSLIEMLPLIPPGLVLDVAAGTGRHTVALARAGFRVVAADYAEASMQILCESAGAARLPILPVLADLEDGFPFAPGSFDAVVNTNFLDRDLIPLLKRALRPGGMLFFDTFIVDQAAIGHPSDQRFLLRHYELREMLSDMELVRYREGLTVYPSEKQAWRATALARRI